MQLEDPSHPYFAYRDPPLPPSSTPSRAPSLAPSSTDEHSAFGSPSSEYSLLTGKFYCQPLSDMPQNMPDPPDTDAAEDRGEERNSDRQVASRSKWQAVLLEAGGIGAAVSEESMKRLQYCLHWLQVRVLPI